MVNGYVYSVSSSVEIFIKINKIKPALYTAHFFFLNDKTGKL